MYRPALALTLTLAFAACGGAEDETPPVPDQTVVAEGYQSSFSPDGTRLTWSNVVDGAGAIHVGDADGSAPTRLTYGVWDYTPRWSPSGDRIAYGSEAPDDDLFVVPAEGGEPVQITAGPGRDWPEHWLPDGSGVVFVREGEGPTRTLVAPADGGPVRPVVPTVPGGRFAVLAPDGSRAVVSVQDGSRRVLRLHDLTTGETTALTTEGFEVLTQWGGAAALYGWSPDGRRFLYESTRTGTRDIWIADVESGELRQLTTDLNEDSGARWSPDGRWIAFWSLRGGQHDLWAVPADAGRPRRLTDDPDREWDVEWAPDGESVLFTKDSQRTSVRILPADGGTERTVADLGLADVAGSDLDVSEATSSVVLSATLAGNFDLWSLPLAGGEPTRLTTGLATDNQPHVSPDGSTVAFRTDRAGAWDIWVVPSSGGEARPLTEGGGDDAFPRWSPDGGSIAFLSDRASDHDDLWVMSADGSDLSRLTEDLSDLTSSLEWSPDGRAIYLVGSHPERGRGLFRVPVEGGEAELVHADPLMWWGALHPDGSPYAYVRREGGFAYIAVVPTTGGEAQRLSPERSEIYQIQPVWSQDGGTLFVSDFVFEGDAGAYDVMSASWPESEWRRLTDTERIDSPAATTADGGVVIVSTTNDFAVVRIPFEPGADGG